MRLAQEKAVSCEVAPGRAGSKGSNWHARGEEGSAAPRGDTPATSACICALEDRRTLLSPIGPAEIEAGACGKPQVDLAGNGPKGDPEKGTQKGTQSPCVIKRARRSD
jgi:hypothetical protein